MSFTPEGVKVSEQGKALGAAMKKILSGYVDIPDDAMTDFEWADAGAEAIAEANLTLNEPKVVRDPMGGRRIIGRDVAEALCQNILADIDDYDRNGRFERRDRPRYDSIYGDPFDLWSSPTSPYVRKGI